MVVDDVLCFLSDSGIREEFIRFVYISNNSIVKEPLPRYTHDMHEIFIDALISSKVVSIDFTDIDVVIVVDYEEVMARHYSLLRKWACGDNTTDFNSTYPNILDSPE